MTSHPDADSLALLALGEPADPQQLEHVRTCSLCSAELAELRTVVATARSLGPADSPAAPPASVWAGISAELQLRPPAPETGRPRQVTPLRAWRRGRIVGVAAAACAAGIAIGLVLGRTLGPTPGPAPRQDLLASAELAPLPGWDANGSAQVVRSGDERLVRLSVSGLVPRDGFYEAWLLDPATSRLVSLGVVPPAATPVQLALPANVTLTDYPAVDVSLEPLDGDPGHSKVSVARGTFASDEPR